MMTLVEDELESLEKIPDYKRFLKVFIKYQIHSWCQKLSDAGEESFLLTASVSDGTFSHVGSPLGEGFLGKASEIKWKFLSFCSSNDHIPESTGHDLEMDARVNSPLSAATEEYDPDSLSPQNEDRNCDEQTTTADGLEHAAKDRLYQFSLDRSMVRQQQSLSDVHGNHKPGDGLQLNEHHHTINRKVGGKNMRKSSVDLSEQFLNDEIQIKTEPEVVCLSDSVDEGLEACFMQQIRHVRDRGDFNASHMDISVYRAYSPEEQPYNTHQADWTVENFPSDVGDLRAASKATTKSMMSRNMSHLSSQTESECFELQCDAQSLFPTKVKLEPGDQPSLGLEVEREVTSSDQGTEIGGFDVGELAEESHVLFPRRKQNKRTQLNKLLKFSQSDKYMQCPICKKILTRNSNMGIHLRTHTGERPYECPVCLRKFNNGSNLKVHVRIHTGERRYQCHVCRKTFTQSSHLNRHVGTHGKNSGQKF